MIFTSEAVSEGHPDKIADQISDAILDSCLKINNKARVACEVFCCYKKIIISGEISKELLSKINPEKTARSVLKNIGYDNDAKGLDYRTFPIEILINSQSEEISTLVTNAVEKKDELGAGDQGIMYGYACNNPDTNYMPLAITIANDLVKTASQYRKLGKFKGAYPDMKSQVSIDITNPKKPSIFKVAMSIQVDKNINENEVKRYVIENIIKIVLKKYNLSLKDNESAIITLFYLGGPKGDTGLTGRKIIADTYGGWAKHGGGAFSGKDATKVDRSGAYMGRYIAKNIVASGICDECEIEIAYLIGHSKPVSIYVNSFNSILNKKISDSDLVLIVNNVFNLSPSYMIQKLNLNAPCFLETACYGHFGKPNFTWEKLDMIKLIQSEYAKLVANKGH